jgi:hypothetical protein
MKINWAALTGCERLSLDATFREALSDIERVHKQHQMLMWTEIAQLRRDVLGI